MRLGHAVHGDRAIPEPGRQVCVPAVPSEGSAHARRFGVCEQLGRSRPWSLLPIDGMRRHHSASAVGRGVVRSHRLRNRSGRAGQGDRGGAGGPALAGGAAGMKRALLALAVSLVAGGSTLAQEDVAAFFRGKTLRLVVGVGSGYDINARLLARHLAAHIPGQPTIVVQNQPGAGSLTMTNALYHTRPFDGTVMGASFNGKPTLPLLQPTGVRF